MTQTIAIKLNDMLNIDKIKSMTAEELAESGYLSCAACPKWKLPTNCNWTQEYKEKVCYPNLLKWLQSDSE